MMVAVLGWLIDPLANYGFMRYGLAAALIVGVTTSMLSCLLVVRHQALMGDAISHAVLPGVVVGYLIGGSTGIFAGALLVALATGVAITYVERHSNVELDAVMGIVFTGLFALGLAIMSTARPRGIDLFHVLFGNVLGVSPGDLWVTLVTGSIVVVVLLGGFRTFHLWSFDPLMAEAIGMRTGFVHYVFTLLLSAVIVAALQAVGLVLVVAMLITPGATARLVATRLQSMMAIAVLVGVLSAAGGLYGSYYVDVASGPAIVLVATAFFFLAFFLAPKSGLFARRVDRKRRRSRVIREDLVKALFDENDDNARIAAASLVERIGGDASSIDAGLVVLEREGKVSRADRDVYLTPAGRTEALRLVRAHRLIEQYSHYAEGVPLDELHEVAERREHELDAADLADLDNLLGSPTVDPHGHPIPTERGELALVTGRQMIDLPLGTVGTVTMVADDRSDLLREMVRYGLLPNTQVEVLEAHDDYLLVAIGTARHQVPREVGTRVYVSLTASAQQSTASKW